MHLDDETTSGSQCRSLMKVDSHWAEMMDANDVGDIKESYASAIVAFGSSGGSSVWVY